VLLEFYKYPAERWVHLRTTNPIESTFATVRLRTKVTKGPGTRAAGIAIAYKLIDAHTNSLAGRQRTPPGLRRDARIYGAPIRDTTTKSCASSEQRPRTAAGPDIPGAARSSADHRGDDH
jgi:hypothetical protein